MLQFGSIPPVAILKHNDEVYARPTQGLAQLQATELKRAQKRAAAEARTEYSAVMHEARELLKESPKSEVPAVQRTEAELMVTLDAVCYNLHHHMVVAHAPRNSHLRRNTVGSVLRHESSENGLPLALVRVRV